MKVEDKCCLPEQAVKLYDLGLRIKTERYWFSDKNFDPPVLVLSSSYQPDPYDPDWDSSKFSFVPAPDVAEFGIILGYGEDNLYHIKSIHQLGLDMIWTDGKTEAQKRANAVIYKLETGELKAEDIKL